MLFFPAGKRPLIPPLNSHCSDPDIKEGSLQKDLNIIHHCRWTTGSEQAALYNYNNLSERYHVIHRHPSLQALKDFDLLHSLAIWLMQITMVGLLRALLTAAPTSPSSTRLLFRRPGRQLWLQSQWKSGRNFFKWKRRKQNVLIIHEKATILRVYMRSDGQSRSNQESNRQLSLSDWSWHIPTSVSLPASDLIWA